MEGGGWVEYIATATQGQSRTCNSTSPLQHGGRVGHVVVHRHYNTGAE